ncbi:nicotinamide-nucleotide amidase [Ferriphaselus sp. R-1]|uniref:nicotinamide-nucleotide amidase n=1 Tax=Ferriphaselus sp. R-1 TaxID=1485544 RepID=UPI000558EE44|nr:nicotinamide-nucleotide amidase [Ferriphaselus sp. R-1]
MDILAAQVGGLLKSHGMMLAAAESCTGGAVAAAITDIAGSSAWFERGFVTYANAAKVEMLGVNPATLDRYGAVSEATVREMALGALQHSHAHISLAISGIAGPDGGSPDKPVGTVWFAWARKHGEVVARLHLISGGRNVVRAQSVRVALQGVADMLNQRTLLA